MLIQIANLLLQVLVSIVAGACLLRCYLQWLAFNLGSGQSRTIGAYVLPLSNWIVIPLRKIVPSVGRFDVASFLAAYLLVVGKTAILLLLSGATLTNISWLLLALIDLVDLILSGLVGLVFASVILSWVSAGSQIQYLVSLLVEPLLAPIRKAMPNFGALDLSPLLLLLILQVLQIVASNLR
ncbi:YggT family protein [Polynucleobacter sp. AP-Sving-400A-A2]|uniref:YggT family protein n=1 Tax=Polynucleobacter sp. AP-Sving-400A-A2 TaxID=2081049 RepID=UPI001BFD3C30|nr:YggT family protein [Polynucleobacter sp. AP-Sving-400A-A2]QWE15134.1 YggT family protein [Polynucleobacter sp. AP-Sving-400A-A2]